jgi:hypothetical protein
MNGRSSWGLARRSSDLHHGSASSGKSTVCDELEARGYAAIDADDYIGVWISRGTAETLTGLRVFRSHA